MPQHVDLADAVVSTWHTSNRVTTFLFENLPSELWRMEVPGAPRRTVGMIAGHIHNARCMWIKILGRRHGVHVPASVDRHRVTRRELVPALGRSSDAVVQLLEIGLQHGGTIPAAGVAWVNLPTDVVHVLGYLVAHEAHHRGQIVLVARQAGHRLSPEITAGLWQWSKRKRETRVGARDGSNRRLPVRARRS